MPLPFVVTGRAAQCTARAKHSRLRCKNPAAFGCKTCRNHGARRPETIRRGVAHPQYRHAKETQAAKAARSARLAQLRDLEATMVTLGVMQGKRWPGRKPKAT